MLLVSTSFQEVIVLVQNYRKNPSRTNSDSRKIIQNVQDTYYLVNIVDHNFVSGDLFADLVGIFVDYSEAAEI